MRHDGRNQALDLEGQVNRLPRASRPRAAVGRGYWVPTAASCSARMRSAQCIEFPSGVKNSLVLIRRRMCTPSGPDSSRTDPGPGGFAASTRLAAPCLPSQRPSRPLTTTRGAGPQTRMSFERRNHLLPRQTVTLRACRVPSHFSPPFELEPPEEDLENTRRSPGTLKNSGTGSSDSSSSTPEQPKILKRSCITARIAFWSIVTTDPVRRAPSRNGYRPRRRRP
jgi:hypothetical protein